MFPTNISLVTRSTMYELTQFYRLWDTCRPTASMQQPITHNQPPLQHTLSVIVIDSQWTDYVWRVDALSPASSVSIQSTELLHDSIYSSMNPWIMCKLRRNVSCIDLYRLDASTIAAIWLFEDLHSLYDSINPTRQSFGSHRYNVGIAATRHYTVGHSTIGLCGTINYSKHRSTESSRMACLLW